MAEQRAQRRLAAILAADVVGYSRLMGEDETGTLAALKQHLTGLIAPTIAEHQGRIFKLMGDGVLAEFASVVDAVECAVSIQRGMADRTADTPETSRIIFRIGINLGDVIVDGDDIYGDGVNVAARLEGLSELGGVCISGTVFDQVKSKLDLSFDDLGPQEVKNIAEPVRVYQWQPVAPDADTTSETGHSLQLPDKPSIAVLPFSNMSNDPEQEYFSDGITEDIITALSRIRQFFVIARNTTFTYKGRSVDVAAVARELRVRYVLEGSVRKSGNRVRITGQLIDGDTGNHIWAERYDRDLEDIFEVQDEITQTVVGAIEPEMAAAERERAKSKPAENLAAWDFYQRGMSVIWDRENHGNLSPETLQVAKQFYEQAIERDPKFADPYAGLALCYFYFLIFGFSEDRAADGEKGLLAGRHAVTFASDNALARSGLGYIHIARCEPNLAIHHCGAAVEINPSGFHERIGLAMALIWSGQPEQALQHLEMCLRLSPRNPSMGPVLVRFAEAHFQLGDYDKSVDYANQALLRPETGILGNCVKASALAHLGRPDEAGEALNELLRRRPGMSVTLIKESVAITDQAFLQTYVDGLRKAGLPEN
ncbi:MAG: adenylate cyclase [Alphaproteobacteria bacterium]|jgi:adenylate cyclase